MNKKKILIVDDSPSTAQLIQKIFDLAGYASEIALGGEEALQKTSTQRFDCILLDVMMPDLDGFEVCRLLKQSDFTNSIPVVFITALMDEDSRKQGFDAGGEAFITKPFRFDGLFNTIDELIKYIPRESIEIVSFVREPVYISTTYNERI